MANELIEDVKIEEGFSAGVYKCTKGFDTIGYGTKLPIDKEEAELLLRHRLNKVLRGVNSSFKDLECKPEVWDILYNMSYQLGLNGLLKFKKMINALYAKDYKLAAEEGRKSNWYKQTPNRAERLMSRLEKL